MRYVEDTLTFIDPLHAPSVVITYAPSFPHLFLYVNKMLISKCIIRYVVYCFMKHVEPFNEFGGGGGFDDSIPGDVNRTTPSGNRTGLSHTWTPASLPQSQLLSQGY